MASKKPGEWEHILFNWWTLRLLAAKYIYYITPEYESFMKDESYDRSEKGWHQYGREWGFLKDEETSPCVDFDWNHPMARDAEILANYYNSRCKTTPEVIELMKKYKQD